MKKSDIEEKARNELEEESKNIRPELYKKALGENWYKIIFKKK